jgi:hypothetical protein
MYITESVGSMDQHAAGRLRPVHTQHRERVAVVTCDNRRCCGGIHQLPLVICHGG